MPDTKAMATVAPEAPPTKDPVKTPPTKEPDYVPPEKDPRQSPGENPHIVPGC